MQVVRQYWVVLIALGLAALMALRADAAQVVEADHVRVSWLAPDSLGANTHTTTIGLLFEVDPHWHVYWRNPGDSGAAPRFAWQGNYAHISDPQWPFPTRLPVAHLTNLGYEGDVAYVFEVQLPKVAPAQLQLSVDLEWLVCSDEECLPGFGSLSLSLPIAGEEDRWQASLQERLAAFQARLPHNDNSGAPWQVSALAMEADGHLLLSVRETQSDAPPPAIYPLQGEFVSAAAPTLVAEQTFAADSGGVRREQQWRFVLEPAASVPAHWEFVLAAGDQAWQLPPLLLAPTPGLDALATAVSEPLWWLLLMAFVGGIVLNLMPCVFPVLSIKLFSLIKHQQAPLALRMREGLAYSAGVVLTFALLGLGFLLLRAAGAGVGWGFQLQSPWVVLALVLLFWLMALSFIGAFEFGHRTMSLAGSLAGEREGRSASGGSFMTGVLAVFVAAPCTGPFMGAALGASASLPPLSAMAIFIGLGLGLAAPFLVLAASPRLTALLPKPGLWMERLRQSMAFPLFASVLWLLWVLDELLGGQAWLPVAALLLLVGFAIWLGKSAGRITKTLAWLLVLVALVFTANHLRAPGEQPRAPASSAWQGFDAAIISQAQAQGRGVFIDYTAAWCITCQVNKKWVLDTPETQALFAEHNTLLVRADWTRYDERITQALAQLGRNSVPVYVYYAPGAREPQLLPQILTAADITGLF